jgi:hypothetical protein
MCTCQSKLSKTDCNVEELKNPEKGNLNEIYNTNPKSEYTTNENNCESSPPLRANKPKETAKKNKIPQIVINKETNSISGGTAIFQSTTQFNQVYKDLMNKHSLSSGTLENNLMASFTKSSNKSHEVDLQDRKFENIEKNQLLSMDTIKEEVVLKVIF